MLTYPLRANAALPARIKANSAFGRGGSQPRQSAVAPEPRAATAIERLDKTRAGKADAMIVDWLRSGLDDPTILEVLRQQRVHSPDLVSSALAAANERIQELRAGGDDHPTKPFAIIEMIAGIEALLRRLTEEPDTVLRVGPVELDLLARTAKRGDRRIKLLPREFRLLEYMMRRKDQLVTRATLFKEVWNYKFVPRTNLVDVHMGRLRRKLDQPAEQPMIYSIRGEGFVLRAPT